MIELFSLEFWIVLLFIINFIFIIILFLFVKKMNQLNPVELDPYDCDDKQENTKYASGSAAEIIELLEPLVTESKEAAISFGKQIKEKKRLIKELNDALDSRIISINLLLSRSDALQKKLEERQRQPIVNSSSIAVLDQQNQIIKMYDQHFDIDTIAQRLSIPKGEVQLVIDLKKKFVEMEKNSR
jgi:cytochrome oxidase Cu insertion factor (SCO1/SenC/PrrC family)